jgi:Flp pilus assembly protein CpaB
VSGWALLPAPLSRDLQRALGRHRTLLAAGLAAAAMAAALNVLAPRPPATVGVVAAAHDLPPGRPLVTGDLRLLEVPRSLAPAGALSAVASLVGRVLAAPVRAGETLTDVRLAGAGLLSGRDPALVAVPVRLADAAATALLRAGDHVDVLAASTAPGAPPYAQVVAPDATVLAVPSAAGDPADGALVVLAASRSVAGRLAAAAVSSRLSVAVRGAS